MKLRPATILHLMRLAESSNAAEAESARATLARRLPAHVEPLTFTLTDISFTLTPREADILSALRLKAPRRW